jgi:DNA-binding transcriptional LysR family regulator
MAPLHLAPNLILVLAHLLKTKSVGSTAMMLGMMSQPSVSRHLAQLREAIQDPLLVRAGNQMARTPRGEELVGRLSDWMSTTASLFDTCEFTPAQIAAASVSPRPISGWRRSVFPRCLPCGARLPRWGSMSCRSGMCRTAAWLRAISIWR